MVITWDYIEGVSLAEFAGSYERAIKWISLYAEHATAIRNAEVPSVRQGSAIRSLVQQYDVIVTDPPYYDAIPYSDLMDYFYVWLRRTLYGFSPTFDTTFRESLSPKWNPDENDGELIDDESRHCGDAKKSKVAYEDGMARAFQACHASLTGGGRLVIVFANKQANAWETLAAALIRAGFIVNGSWPIQTEMGNRLRGISSAALASSVWLVCKKRPATARPGWDSKILDEMRANIGRRLREF
jgi:adenine-specific DNA methylase